jgi:hypothetical protein
MVTANLYVLSYLVRFCDSLILSLSKDEERGKPMILTRVKNERDQLQEKIDRLKEALERIGKRDYNKVYTPETYAVMVLAREFYERPT